jgi:hypothetical protein
MVVLSLVLPSLRRPSSLTPLSFPPVFLPSLGSVSFGISTFALTFATAHWHCALARLQKRTLAAVVLVVFYLTFLLAECVGGKVIVLTCELRGRMLLLRRQA